MRTHTFTAAHAVGCGRWRLACSRSFIPGPRIPVPSPFVPLRVGFLLCVSIVVLIVAASAAHAQGSFQGLGFLDPAIATPGSAAYGISDDGTTIVGWSTNSAGVEVPMRWDAISGMSALGTPAGGSTTRDTHANDASADGAVIVGTHFRADGTGHNEAFIWDATNGIRLIGTLGAGSPRSFGHAISADGLVVAGESTGRAFRWDAVSGMQSLEPFGSDPTVRAWYLSGDGSLLVGLASIPAGVAGIGAFAWDLVGGLDWIPGIPGSSSGSAQAKAVTPDGHAIAGNEGTLVFRWTA